MPGSRNSPDEEPERRAQERFIIVVFLEATLEATVGSAVWL
jgi:hypothetical protein